MFDPDSVLSRWTGIIDNDFQLTIQQTFGLPPADDDDYKYRVETMSMTLSEVQAALKSRKFHYWYSLHDGQQLKAPPADIDAYTQIFASTTSTASALRTFLHNARKASPRTAVATYLCSRLFPAPGSSDGGDGGPPVSPAGLLLRAPKLKAARAHVNPYYDVWAWSCHETGFLGPLDLPAYADPGAARVTHPVLPVLYHHFGCVCPSWEALSVLAGLVGVVVGVKSPSGGGGVVDMGSGNGYWTFMLRRMGVSVTAVDSMEATWRTMWMEDTVKADGVEYLRRQGGAREKVLLMVYMVPRGDFTKKVLKAYKGDTVVVAGTQNDKRFTGFADTTVEQYFEREKKDFEMTLRMPLPSFAGKDEAMYVYQKKK